MSKEELLSVSDLVVEFPVTEGLLKRVVGSVKAVEHVNLKLREGQVLGIVGESGSGKTTLGRAILQLIPPTSGQVLFNGVDVVGLQGEELKSFRRSAQIIFQNPFTSLNPRKRVLEIIGEGPRFHGLVSSPQQQIELVSETLMRVGLSPDVLLLYPHQLSGGQQQRVCIGRAIALQPLMIVCDEAVSALDVSVQAQILNLLQELKETLSLSYLFISHDLSVVKYLSDEVIVMYLGHVMEKGPAVEVFANPKHPYTQALLSSIPPARPADRRPYVPIKGEIPSARHPPSGCPFRTRCPFAQPICAEPPPKYHVGDKNHEYWCILPP